MKIPSIIAASALALLCGCATLGQFASVSVPSEVPFPEAMTLKLGGSAGQAARIGDAIFGAMGGESIETKLGRSLKQAVLPLRRSTAQAFRSQLEQAGIFGKVVEQGGNLGISLGVGRWGIEYNPASKRLEPVFDIEASLSAPGLGTVWKASRSAKDLAGPVMEKLSALGLAGLASKPEALSEVLNQAGAELCRQLVEDLRSHPPKL